MYETPKLNKIGDAQEVILGYMASGTDLDTQFCAGSMEYADEGEDPSNDVSRS